VAAGWFGGLAGSRRGRVPGPVLWD
jgi:hypothetical protein